MESWITLLPLLLTRREILPHGIHPGLFSAVLDVGVLSPDQLRLLLSRQSLAEGLYVVLDRQVHELVLSLRLDQPGPLGPHLHERVRQ